MTCRPLRVRVDGSRAGFGHRRVLIAAVLVTALPVAVAALLISITERRWEARHPFVRVTEVDEQTIDPAVWGANWPQHEGAAEAPAAGMSPPGPPCRTVPCRYDEI
jgi:hypothetical protein